MWFENNISLPLRNMRMERLYTQLCGPEPRLRGNGPQVGWQGREGRYVAAFSFLAFVELIGERGGRL